MGKEKDVQYGKTNKQKDLEISQRLFSCFSHASVNTSWEVPFFKNKRVVNTEVCHSVCLEG